MHPSLGAPHFLHEELKGLRNPSALVGVPGLTPQGSAQWEEALHPTWPTDQELPKPRPLTRAYLLLGCWALPQQDEMPSRAVPSVPGLCPQAQERAGNRGLGFHLTIYWVTSVV